MLESRTLSDIPLGLALSVVTSAAALAVTLFPVPPVVSVAAGVSFLLVVPGYTVTVALFPRRVPWHGGGDTDGGLRPFDRLVLSVALSVALAVVVGVNISFTPWEIRATTVIGGLVVVTLVAASVGVVRRDGADRRTTDAWTSPGTTNRSLLTANSETLATLLVVVAVAVSLGSVAAVAGTGDRGEQYTEFGLLTEAENGSLVASDLPSSMTVGEPMPLYYTVTNQEQRDHTYFIVVQLQAVSDNGTVTRSERVNRFRAAVGAGERVQRGHTITPTFPGENLRVQYLLYTSQPPNEPSESTAYRYLHIWVDVTG